MLSLFFLVVIFQSCTISKEHTNPAKEVIQEMTVIKILPENSDSNFMKVVFKRSQRTYKLAKDTDPHYILLLKESEQNNTAVLVKRAKEESDVIISVEKVKVK